MANYKDHEGVVVEGGYPSDVHANDIVEVVFRNGQTATGLAYVFDWTHIGPIDKDGDVDIVAYRVEEQDIL